MRNFYYNMENASIYVFTTRKVVIEHSPILRVVHDEDGDWQFFAGNDIPSSQNAMLISLDEIIEIDSSLEELIPQLSIGQTAYRKNVRSPWVVE